MMRPLHILWLALCWALLSAAGPAAACVIPSADAARPAITADAAPPAAITPAPDNDTPNNAAASLRVDRSPARAWLCERACNSDLEPPRPAGELAQHRSVPGASRPDLHPDRKSLRPARAFGLRRAAAYRRTFDSELLSLPGDDCLFRWRRLLI